MDALSAVKVVKSIEEEDGNITSNKGEVDKRLKYVPLIHLMPPSERETKRSEHGQVYQEYQCKNPLQEDDQPPLMISHLENATKPYSYGYIMRRVKGMVVSLKLY